MKIVGICSSPRGRKSRTLALVRAVLDGAREKGAFVELINIGSLSVGFCDACESCGKSGKCHVNDDFSGVLEQVRDADGLVLGSPVYVDNVSAQMKAFVDRMADAIHYQILAGKYGCSVATTWESGGDDVCRYLNHFVNYLGAVSVGSLSVILGDRPDLPSASLNDARLLGATLYESIATSFHDPSQEEWISENREFFTEIVKRNRKFRPDEYNLWVDQGWIR
ncbi:multimeric flavodoxin WrbA [Methanolinea mesophila]|uniref:flavodoxin family protein n=1 Tax=Methanolinea mesophila TaxID=547055 RepID=UPI001AE33328|nr:flavodoxin family protein [Methanolinea mesophila]MBP1929814.1 multimeric flavodoxin WrbA [Methanolinea mesophila]